METEQHSGNGDAEGHPECGAQPRVRAAAAEARSRLDKRTYLDKEQGRWSIKGYDFGGGLFEIGWSFVTARVIAKAVRGESESRELHEDRAVRRARSRLRRLVLAANADHLLTLTYRENVTDFADATNDLGRFVRQVRKHLPGWVYIGVPERQQRGAWHWHLAVVGRQDVVLLRSLWVAVVGSGNIDVQPPKHCRADQRLALVKYLGKYLAKGFEEGSRELNGHRYRASLGIQVPVQSIELLPEHRGRVADYALEQLRKRAGAVGFVWTDERQLMGWACSWK